MPKEKIRMQYVIKTPYGTTRTEDPEDVKRLRALHGDRARSGIARRQRRKLALKNAQKAERRYLTALSRSILKHVSRMERERKKAVT